MLAVRNSEVAQVVNDCFEKAWEVAENVIVFNEWTKRAKALMLASLPRFAAMPTSYGYAGWAAVLSVDLRGSSTRALAIGAKKTFITMQTYVPTMAYLVGQAGGKVVGLRGDGLFATFGFAEDARTVTRVAAGDAVMAASCCGDLMIKTVAEVINPVLDQGRVGGGLRIGVGIGAGAIVVTRIGWEDAQEVTAYGDEINHACKVRADNCVVLSYAARELYPASADGQAYFVPHAGDHRLVLPANASVILPF
jgi:class 3 adenylate cyclase